MLNKLTLIENTASEFEQIYGGCAQAVLAGFKENTKVISDDLFRAGTGLAGGIGLTGNVCGALLGGALVIGAVRGRSFNDLKDPDKIRYQTLEMVRELYEAFEAEYGSVCCYDIQTKLMGNSFNLWTQSGKRGFLEKGGRKDKCPSVCRNSVRWVYEILNGRNLAI
ncbi:MAG: C_GCAxxG_C_C family protein [Firmicutes bacterium]|nr:C_GCAxxG_C_C family protein [Bacillota bacterium]